MMYRLEGTIVVPENDPAAWGKAITFQNHVVARDHFKGVKISTVFIGLDASDADPPMVFETMVFGGSLHQEVAQSATWEEAEVKHVRVCETVLRSFDTTS